MRIIFVLFCTIFYLYAEKDFTYSYIGIDGHQISFSEQKAILDGYEHLKAISTIFKEGNIDLALDKIIEMENSNKIDILNSPIILLKSEIMLKKEAKRYSIDGSNALEKAINSSIIHEDDLPRAYMLLIDMFLKINKLDEAEYFAKMLSKSFDDPLIKAYGTIYQSKLFTYKKEYKKSTRMLYDILTKTDDLDVATIVAQELFDVFLLNEEENKAYDLIMQVINNNISFYINNSYEAMEKVKKMQEHNMPEAAAKVLEELIEHTSSPFLLEEFKYRLAVSYMDMYYLNKEYLQKAKTLFEELYNSYRDGRYAKNSKIYIDEILMREGKLEPMILVERYPESFAIEQKVLVQELINLTQIKDYDSILKAKKIYDKIPDSIMKKFAYNNIDELYNIVMLSMVSDYIEQNRCKDILKVVNYINDETFYKIIEDEKRADGFFRCMVDYPNEKLFYLAKESYNSSRDAKIYFSLEQAAINLGLLDEAYNLSLKVEMVNNPTINKEEFLYKFLILSQKDDKFLLDRFFANAQKTPDLIEYNEKNPMILDFYYRYYFYLLKQKQNKKALEVLNELYQKQGSFNAMIYSPFVEMELSKNEFDKKEYNKALLFLDEGVQKSRLIKNEDLVKIYYEKAKIYKNMLNFDLMQEYVDKCIEVEGLENNLYQQMCRRL